MNQIALTFNHTILYWYSIVLALSAASGICLFFACCSHKGICLTASAATALLALFFSLFFSRLLFWYCRPFRFESWRQALTTPDASCHALLGAFVGCLAAALCMQRTCGGLPTLLDCMSTAGCGAIFLGRLAFFFSDGDRGRILSEDFHLPWAYPIIDPSSGLSENRLATFLLQAITVGILFLVLLFLFLQNKHPQKSGRITLFFLMVYSASQAILDSTRYDALYLHSNGFISLIQLLSALTLVAAIAVCSFLAVRQRGIQKWMIVSWILIPCLFGGAGYMEYFVQRHGNQASFGYRIMGGCLAAILLLGIFFWQAANENASTKPAAKSTIQ